jgi:hypothetical protein
MTAKGLGNDELLGGRKEAAKIAAASSRMFSPLLAVSVFNTLLAAYN